MAGRKAAGRAPAKRSTAGAATAATSSKNTARNASSAAASTLASLALADSSEDADVTLLYRKPSSRGAARAPVAAVDHASPSSFSSSLAAAAAAAVVPSSDKAVMDFWRRLSGPVNLTRYLSHCGVQDIQLRSDSGSSVHTVTQMQVFHCSPDRLATALAALHNMDALLFTPHDTSAAPLWVGHSSWVRPQHQEAMVALARVCEAAVPLQLPSLLQPVVVAAMRRAAGEGMEGVKDSSCVAGASCRPTPTVAAPSMVWRVALSQAGGPRGASALDSEQDETTGKRLPGKDAAAASSAAPSMVDLVPSPVLRGDVHRRLRCLLRLRLLRVAYADLLPRLHAARTVAELTSSLFALQEKDCLALHRLRDAWVSRPHQKSEVYNIDTATTVHHSEFTVRGGKESGAAPHAELLLSSYLGNPAVLDGLQPLVGITARHPQEELLLQHLVGSALREDSAVEAAAWGPMAGMANWRITDGLYVVQHACRVRVLRRLIAEAQFYGLPRFLRSIRVPSAGWVPGHGSGDWWTCADLQRAQARYPDQFFLTPDALDPAMFTQPESMQVQVVHEELITLQRTHCAFCLLAGEADEVATLLHEHLASMSKAWMPWAAKKKEEEKDGGTLVKQEPQGEEEREAARMGDTHHRVASGDEGEHQGGNGASKPAPPLHDPLLRYVLRTVEAASQHEREALSTAGQPPAATATATAAAASTSSSSPSSLPFSHVQWTDSGSSNRWSANTHYYGVVFMVVLETVEWGETEEGSLLVTEGLLPSTAIDVADEGTGRSLRPPRVPAYCVNAMVELWRS